MQIRSIVPLQGPRFGAGPTYDDVPANASASIRWPRPIGSIPWPPRPMDGSSHTMYAKSSILGFLRKAAVSKTNGLEELDIFLSAPSSCLHQAQLEGPRNEAMKVENHLMRDRGLNSESLLPLSSRARVRIESEIRKREHTEKTSNGESRPRGKRPQALWLSGSF